MGLPLLETHYKFPGQTAFYKGKVRDVYTINDDLLVMVVTDRISAFDVVMPKGIPYKGQALNQIASDFMESSKRLVPNWLIATPDPNVSIGRKCAPFKVEMVIRGYLAGHAAREYKAGKRTLCGVPLPDGLKENDRLPKPIITPSTKADLGLHDEDISKEEILRRQLVTPENYDILERYTNILFEEGSRLANKQGLILVDTKYEFGKTPAGDIVLIDEAHTPDSSRYFFAQGYEERQIKGDPQKQLSKEFVRQWLIGNGFQGKPEQKIPPMTDSFVEEVSKRYIELYELLTGKAFVKADTSNMSHRIEANVLNCLNRILL